MFSVERILPHDDRDVLAYDPNLGLVVACYLRESDRWVHGWEKLYDLAAIPHKFNPTHWMYLDVEIPVD